MRCNRKNILKKICLAVSLSSYLAIASAIGQSLNDTLRLYANENILKFKEKKLSLKGDGRTLWETDKTPINRIEILLSKTDSGDLIEVPIVIEYLNEKKNYAKLYIVINGQKYSVDLTCYLEYNSQYDKKKYFILPEGKIVNQVGHCDHYSHSSHYSHISSSP